MALIADKQHLKSDAIFTNEGIVATAVYCVESTNVNPPSIAFRMRTSPNQPDLRERVRYGTHQYAEEIYRTSIWPTPGQGKCFQSYGNVLLEQGRLVAYPTTLYVLRPRSMDLTKHVGPPELTHDPVSIATPTSLPKTRQNPGGVG